MGMEACSKNSITGYMLKDVMGSKEKKYTIEDYVKGVEESSKKLIDAIKAETEKELEFANKEEDEKKEKEEKEKKEKEEKDKDEKEKDEKEKDEKDKDEKEKDEKE